MSVSIEKLHHKARRAVESGENSFRQAAEYLAEAQKLGATQRQSAKAIGKSPAWVNVLLKWKAACYRGTPFGPQSKAKRTAVQATKRSRQPMTAEEALAQKAQAEFQTARAVAVAKMFGAETKRIPNGARKELLKALRMLGSERPVERASAALMVETQRARLNLTWDDLIVPAEAESEVSEAA
jgi:alpha-beta hydrolase superfamily lysophospholipase